MKKLTITSLVFGVLSSGMAIAQNTGEMQFIGAVTAATCDIKPEIDGVFQSTVDLGTIKNVAGELGAEKIFKLVPDVECQNNQNAFVGWQSAGLDTVGLANMSGNATGVSILLTAIDGKNTPVTANQQNIPFSNTDGLKSFDFKVQMKANEEGTIGAGTVIAAASYAVAYN